MDLKGRKWRTDRNILKLVNSRELNSNCGSVLKERFQFAENFVNRLGLEVELEGHQGCVNCLEWGPHGQHLASGSDDTNVILWDTFRHKKVKIIPTPHVGNIFSVKFLGDESVIATGAGDCRVIVQNVCTSNERDSPLLDCSCHIGRVKRLATCPDLPTLFWSAGEDGLVMQYDMREPHECPSKTQVLIDFSYKTDLKCIAINPTKPHYLAIGANDCFVRLYDRRMIKVSPCLLPRTRFRRSPQPENSECVQYYAPAHLAIENSEYINMKQSITYIAFNRAGSELLANIGGEQIYLFDLNQPRSINQVKIPENLPKRSGKSNKNCCKSAKPESNSQLHNDNCASFFMQRAFKFYNRQWGGDLYGAARDYLHVIEYYPDHKRAYIGLIKALIALKWKEEAQGWVDYFLNMFPDNQDPVLIKALLEEIENIKEIPDPEKNEMRKVDNDEKKLRLESLDFEKRYLGHCNTTTDIKEANFLGDDENFICAGSDEGIIFIWDKRRMDVVTALFGDESIVNCVQPHPSACVIASSGIDTAVKIWAPIPEDGTVNSRIVKSLSTVIVENQHRMLMDRIVSMWENAEYHLRGGNNGEPLQQVVTCHTS